MTIVSDPDFEVDGPDEDPTVIIEQTDDQVADGSDPTESGQTESDQDVDVAEAEADDAEAEAEAEIETEIEDDEEASDAELEADLDVDDEADEDTDIEPEAEADLAPDAEDDVEADADAEDGADVEVEVDVDAEVEAEVDVEAEDQTDIPVEDGTEDEVAAKLGSHRAVVAPEAAVAAIEPAAQAAHRANGGGPANRPWTNRQLLSVLQRAFLVFTVLGMVGYGLGALRGDSHVARTEFVYTLDESVPDSFLREDRRLLTQVVTFKSDAVLTPVAEEFNVTVDALRAKIDVETLELSEVLRLDVSDGDAERAVAISRSVLDRYLQVITDATPADDNQELAQRRIDVAEQLAEADASRRVLLQSNQDDAVLQVEQAAIQRQIDLKNEQLNRLQQSIDDSLLQTISAARQTSLAEQFDATRAELVQLETELGAIGAERAALQIAATAEPSLLREIERLEAKLQTIDDELSERELAPLVASPIRELSQPIVLFRSMHLFGLQGMALGLMAAIPLAALVAYRSRQRQLWFN